MSNLHSTLYEAVLSLRSEKEAEAFLADLTTPAEFEALTERWRIANLLYQGGKSYREIAAETGASTTTIARVARFLHDEGNDGYKTILERTAQKRGKK